MIEKSSINTLNSLRQLREIINNNEALVDNSEIGSLFKGTPISVVQFILNADSINAFYKNAFLGFEALSISAVIAERKRHVEGFYSNYTFEKGFFLSEDV